MAPVPSTKCAACGAEATMRCSGCLNAPEYQTGDSTAVVYCNGVCQKGHRPKHKGHCKDMQKRKTLLRAAQLLKAAMLAYRETVYDLDLTKIELKDGVLYLHQKVILNASQPKRGSFPGHLTNNIEHKEAALVNNQCTAAMALLGPLTRKLLKDMPFQIEIMDITVGKPRVPTRLIPGPNSQSAPPHTVLKIRNVRNNETWIVDTTGCQYGFRDVLVPFNTYFLANDCQTRDSPQTYDACETKDLDYFETIPLLTMTKALRMNLRLERQSRQHFAVFVARTVGDKILGGSDVEFRVTIDHFVNGLKSHMRAIL